MKRRSNPKAVTAVRMAATATDMWPRALLFVSVDHVTTKYQLQGAFCLGIQVILFRYQYIISYFENCAFDCH